MICGVVFGVIFGALRGAIVTLGERNLTLEDKESGAFIFSQALFVSPSEGRHRSADVDFSVVTRRPNLLSISFEDSTGRDGFESTRSPTTRESAEHVTLSTLTSGIQHPMMSASTLTSHDSDGSRSPSNRMLSFTTETCSPISASSPSS